MADSFAAVLPCSPDGICMICNQMPPEEEILPCVTCASSWHVACLAVRPDTAAEALEWECPDCSPPAEDSDVMAASESSGVGGGDDGGLIAAIRAVEADESLTEGEKAKKRQEIMSSKTALHATTTSESDDVKNNGGNEVFDVLNSIWNCTICMQLPERPVTTQCNHTFCVRCYERYVAQGNHSCPNCRQPIQKELRINEWIVKTIRDAKKEHRASKNYEKHSLIYFIKNQHNRPDKAFVTERAKKAGNANASAGRTLVTTAHDHFGPTTVENDPTKKRGVLVGDTWSYRNECKQWGVHRPMVSGIAGQSQHGAQSVVISGGYVDDEDHGEWFMYTGSGGRDLRGNKRTSKDQGKDQEFTNLNHALRVSCLKGYPVRVVRSHKEKRSCFAPTKDGLRYDGVYRIEKCWRKQGMQGFKVCRYLFVRCDNEPAPWTRNVMMSSYSLCSNLCTHLTFENKQKLICSDEHGGRPRPMPVVDELEIARDITERTCSPS